MADNNYPLLVFPAQLAPGQIRRRQIINGIIIPAKPDHRLDVTT